MAVSKEKELLAGMLARRNGADTRRSVFFAAESWLSKRRESFAALSERPLKVLEREARIKQRERRAEGAHGFLSREWKKGDRLPPASIKGTEKVKKNKTGRPPFSSKKKNHLSLSFCTLSLSLRSLSLLHAKGTANKSLFHSPAFSLKTHCVQAQKTKKEKKNGEGKRFHL